MRILHTSDWHLGASLAGRKRYEDGEKFLDWLIQTIIYEQVETLIVAGDVFDSANPSNQVLELYYRFLGRAGKAGCRHIVITAGNHDSPSLLTAPKELLLALDIRVIGAVSDTLSDEVFILNDLQDTPALIICAVPFLRDRDIRTSEPGESIEEKQNALNSGVRAHYRDVCAIAEEYQRKCGGLIPIVATGHLFAAGGYTLTDDGVRELSIGTLIQVGADTFPDCIDYLALGHLHQPQLVHGSPTRRYSGAPLAMGFGESNREKVVVLVNITPDRKVMTRSLVVPPFRSLLQLRGSVDDIRNDLGSLRFSGKPAWIEIILEDPHAGPAIRDEFYQMVEGSGVDVLKVKNSRFVQGSAVDPEITESLDDFNPLDVFKRCLIDGNEPEEERDTLIAAFREILAELQEGDLNAV